jgi:predicted ribosomally synthesized peptide with nif11-like leader
MSVQNALKFINQVIDDEALYMAVKTLPDGNLDALRTTASEAGFAFTAQEWEQALERRRPETGDELDDSALESVAGGVLSTSTMSINLPTALHSFSGDYSPLGKSACKSCKACSKCKKSLPELGDFRF